MKVSLAIRSIYEELIPSYETLKDQVDPLVIGNKQSSWHYLSRIKSLESFAQKLETGRFPDFRIPEDLFACTVVVDNHAAIALAEEKIKSLFLVKERRPRDAAETLLRPSQFDFDDLRIYCSLKPDETRKSLGTEGFLFEIQIKTFLSHAWGIATHDLVYKGENINWAANRIAYQVKAMLEHAELTIASAALIAGQPEAKREDSPTKETRKMIIWLRDHWEPARLPKDAIRLATTILEICKFLSIAPLELRQRVDLETQAGRGASFVNLSPYSAILKAIFETPDFVSRFSTVSPYLRRKNRLLIVPEIELPPQGEEIEKLLIRIEPI